MRKLSRDERRRLRRAQSLASEKYNIGGVEKVRSKPKAITLTRAAYEAAKTKEKES